MFGRLLTALVLCSLVGSCASTDEATEKRDRTPRRVEALKQEREQISLPLAIEAKDVSAIQLYSGTDEALLPILAQGSGDFLTLEFDLLQTGGRPLSIYFYHADREWNRDLVPAEYMATFHSDDLLDYRSSQATEIDYVHYRYQVPNRNIQFRLSGNYIMRVTEQGLEDEILFERPFYVTEQAVDLGLSMDRVVADGGYTAIQPLVQFVPPSSIEPNLFDLYACFIKNGAFGRATCSDRPSLMNPPAVQFYLESNSVFAPISANYFLDLSDIRNSPRIERTDVTVSPFVVELDPDYQQFAGSGIDPLLNGQTIIRGSVRDVAEPSTGAQYVDVLFTFVPVNEERLPGRLSVVGSFNNWRGGEHAELLWIPENKRYEGIIRMKQGQYEYRYLSSNVQTQRAINQGFPRPDNLITAFIYFRDLTKQTDRLLAADGFYSR